jgi:DNA-directed RNA polymerase subunit alpha
MIELENAQIASIEDPQDQTYGKYEASPLRAGYGVTLGNALRRVLLSSLEGAAVTSVQIRDVSHEFSTIPGVKEDVIQILLNLKRLRLKGYVPHPTQLKLVKSGAGPVTAADIVESADVEIVNPEQHILTLEPDATIEMDLTVERGTGYLSADDTKEGLPIGVIPVDAIFTPVRRIDYHVENTRVGQVTNYDKLTLEIETDGTITPEEALSRAAEMLVEQFGQFTAAGRKLTSEVEAVAGAEALPPNVLDMPIEDLDLPMRAYNSLKRNNIVKVGQLLQLQDEDLLRMRNFGKKSLDEMKDRLRMRGFLPLRTRPSRASTRRMRTSSPSMRTRRTSSRWLTASTGASWAARPGPAWRSMPTSWWPCSATSASRRPRRAPARCAAWSNTSSRWPRGARWLSAAASWPSCLTSRS